MCEHNLVIGNKYRLLSSPIVCHCGHRWQSGDIVAIYSGDDPKDFHKFIPIDQLTCPSCQGTGGSVGFPCEGNSPIDVTQEFLSLPVRSRK